MARRKKTSGTSAAPGAAEGASAAPATKAPRRNAKKARAGKPRPASRRPKGKRGGHRYSDVERQRILDAAEREQLTGNQVARRFGVTTVTYYLWRKKAKAAGRRRPESGRPKTNGTETGLNLESLVREQIRTRLRELVPQEVARLLDESL